MTTVATLKEIKTAENRVGLTPKGVFEIKKRKHNVLVQENAGLGAGFSDQDYKKAGAIIMKDPLEIVKRADILIKVKEPLEQEYKLLDNFKGKILFTYLHLSGVTKSLTEKLLEDEITGIAYETVTDDDNGLPLLRPMSEVAGVLAIQYGAQYLQKKYNGRGISLGKISNTDPAEVVVVGGGVVGSKAAKTALGLGSMVTLLELSDKKISKLNEEFKKEFPETYLKNLKILKSTPESLAESVKKADLLVGAVLIAGAKAPIVVTEKMVKSMKEGAVIVDVAIDQGGCVWGSKPTTHENPIYKVDGKIFCCIANMPGQVPLQSTQALTNATLPYLLKLADNGINALRQDKNFAKGLNTYKGKITNELVAKDLGMMDMYLPLEEALAL